MSKVLQKALQTLRVNLSEEELIELSELLDGSPENLILDGIDEHLMKIRPDLFLGPSPQEKEVADDD